MPLTIPPELKKITPYVRRAEELDRDKGNPESRLVAYYCRQYAVHTGIGLATSPEGKGCLGELLGNMEGEKQAMDSFTRDESKFLCLKFAEKIFDKADEEDRSGSADRNTARTFYAAASFLEILQQFYQDDDASEELAEQKKKSVYCKWKSTEILKALKEGRTPTPGGYGEPEPASDDEEENEENEGTAISPIVVPETVDEDSDDQNEEESPGLKLPVEEDAGEGSGEEEGTEVQLGPPPTYPVGIDTVEPPILPPAPPMAPPAPPMAPPAPPLDIPKPPLTFNLPAPAPPPVVPKPAPRKVEKPKKTFFGMGSTSKKKSKKSSKAEVADATELTRFALAALEDKDTDLAAQRLEQALKVLGR